MTQSLWKLRAGQSARIIGYDNALAENYRTCLSYIPSWIERVTEAMRIFLGSGYISSWNAETWHPPST